MRLDSNTLFLLGLAAQAVVAAPAPQDGNVVTSAAAPANTNTNVVIITQAQAPANTDTAIVPIGPPTQPATVECGCVYAAWDLDTQSWNDRPSIWCNDGSGQQCSDTQACAYSGTGKGQQSCVEVSQDADGQYPQETGSP